MTKHLLTTVALLALAVSPVLAKHHHPQPQAPTPTAGTPHGAIHGYVRAGAKPLGHIAVHVVNRKHVPAAHTSQSGEFTFSNLRPGVYTLVARTKHHGSARLKLPVTPGHTSELILPLHPHHHWHYLRPGGTATPGHTPGLRRI